MNQKLPAELQDILSEALRAEQKISYGDADCYNTYVAENDYCTAVSASGRVNIGCGEVRNASVQVAKGNIGESDRFLEMISCDYTDTMFYGVVKTGVRILKEDGSDQSLCWIITLIFKKIDGKWRIVHRQNTRA